MARIDLPLAPKEFNFRNGSPELPDATPPVPEVAPCIIFWSMATTPEWDDYERKTFEVFGVQAKGQKPTISQTQRAAAITRQFCWDRIGSVSGFEVGDGPGVRQLVWDADQKLIIAALLKAYTGPTDLFVRTVIGAHRPADQQALEVAGQGN